MQETKAHQVHARAEAGAQVKLTPEQIAHLKELDEVDPPPAAIDAVILRRLDDLEERLLALAAVVAGMHA